MTSFDTNLTLNGFMGWLPKVSLDVHQGSSSVITIITVIIIATPTLSNLAAGGALRLQNRPAPAP